MARLQIYVVSLAANNPRRDSFRARLDTLGLAAEFVDAVDGRDGLPLIDEAEVDRAAAERNAQRKVSDAELACSLSHRRVYEKFLASDASWALVFEDDAIIDERLVRFVDARGYEIAPLIMLHHKNGRVLGQGMAVPGNGDALAFELAVPSFRAAAYTLTRGVAEKLRDAQTPVCGLADWPTDVTRYGAMAIVPEIAGHPLVTSDNSTLESGREKHRAQSLRSWVSASYTRRKWRKFRSRKVS